MTVPIRSIKVHAEDVDILRGRCREVFLMARPEFEGMRLSDAFMIKKLIQHFIE